MDVEILARAKAFVPENQPAGGTICLSIKLYREKGYTVIPVCVQEVECGEEHQKIKEGISTLQEILVKGNLEVPRGSKLELEFDIHSLGGVNHWFEDRKKGRVIRTAPYAVEVRYERNEI